MSKVSSQAIARSLLCFLVAGCLFLAACADENTESDSSDSPTTGYEEFVENQNPEELPGDNPATGEGPKVQYGPTGIKPDEIIDLSDLNTLMAYAEVYDMMLSPEGYFGKTVKLSGTYYAEYYGYTERYHHYIVVKDEQDCCSQGMEFSWEGAHTYPDDYPANESTIELEGSFGYYEEKGSQVPCLSIKEITVKS